MLKRLCNIFSSGGDDIGRQREGDETVDVSHLKESRVVLTDKKKCGEGGFGKVFKADMIVDGKERIPVCVKEFSFEQMANDSASVSREIESYDLVNRLIDDASICNNGFVKIYGSGVIKRKEGNRVTRIHVQIMEPAAGEDYDVVSIRRNNEKKPIPLDVHVGIVLRAAASVHQLHLAGYAHYDIKPKNIRVDLVGDEIKSVKLIDYGLVDKGEKRSDGLYAGTIAYMHARDKGIGSGYRNDCYGLVMTLTEAITGKDAYYSSAIGNCPKMLEKPMKDIELIRSIPDPQLVRLLVAVVERDGNQISLLHQGLAMWMEEKGNLMAIARKSKTP